MLQHISVLHYEVIPCPFLMVFWQCRLISSARIVDLQAAESVTQPPPPCMPSRTALSSSTCSPAGTPAMGPVMGSGRESPLASPLC